MTTKLWFEATSVVGLLLGTIVFANGWINVSKLRHSIFGCNTQVDVGTAMEGKIGRCSVCGTPWLLYFRKRGRKRLTEAEAMDQAEFFSS